MKITTTITSLTVAALAGAAAMTGCQGDRNDKPPRQFFPDMDDSPKKKPQTGTEFFTDGRAMRPQVEHAVAFSRNNVSREILIQKPDWYAGFHGQRQDLLRDEWEIYQGAVPEMDASGSIVYATTGRTYAKVVDRIPIKVDADLIKRGEERFNIYCAVCHGYEGDGLGMVGDQNRSTGWVGGARNLHEAAYKDPTNAKSKDGHLFYVIRNGFYDGSKAQKMPGYGHALSTHDTWAIVAWVRVLQETRSVPMAEIPADKQTELNAKKPAAPAGGKP